MRRMVIIAVFAALVAGGCGHRGGDGPGVRPSTSTTAAPATDVQVFFTPKDAVATDCGTTHGVPRTVTGDPVAGALRALLAGPTAAEAPTLTSWFSPATADALLSVSVADGVARVDLADLRAVIPNASTSCGGAMFLGQLDATVTQFPDVDHAVYSFAGDVGAFYEFLQLAPPV